MICIYTYIKYIYIKCILYINFFCAESWPAWGTTKRRRGFDVWKPSFKVSQSYDNFGDGDHQRIKQKHRGTTDGLHQPVVSDFIFEEKQLR